MPLTSDLRNMKWEKMGVFHFCFVGGFLCVCMVFLLVCLWVGLFGVFLPLFCCSFGFFLLLPVVGFFSRGGWLLGYFNSVLFCLLKNNWPTIIVCLVVNYVVCIFAYCRLPWKIEKVPGNHKKQASWTMTRRFISLRCPQFGASRWSV